MSKKFAGNYALKRMFTKRRLLACFATWFSCSLRTWVVRCQLPTWRLKLLHINLPRISLGKLFICIFNARWKRSFRIALSFGSCTFQRLAFRSTRRCWLGFKPHSKVQPMTHMWAAARTPLRLTLTDNSCVEEFNVSRQAKNKINELLNDFNLLSANNIRCWHSKRFVLLTPIQCSIAIKNSAKWLAGGGSGACWSWRSRHRRAFL